MTDLYAVVRDNLVIRVIVADAPFVEAQRAASAAGATGILEPGDQIIGPAPESCANGWRYDPTTDVFDPPALAETAVTDLVEVKATAVAAINAAAERALNALMPPGRVQVLLATAGQARAVIDAGSQATSGVFPLVAAAVPRHGAHIWEAAEALLVIWEDWVGKAATIQGALNAGLAAIEAAEDAVAVDAALGSLNATLSAA